MTERAVLLRIKSQLKGDLLEVEPIGEVMADDFRQCNLCLSQDVKERFLAQLRRIAKLNELSFPEELDSRGRGTTHVVNLAVELFEHSDDEALIRRW